MEKRNARDAASEAKEASAKRGAASHPSLARSLERESSRTTARPHVARLAAEMTMEKSNARDAASEAKERRSLSESSALALKKGAPSFDRDKEREGERGIP
jgi:hypothetical protein